MPPRMLEHLLCRDTLSRIKSESLAEQIDALFAHRTESAEVFGTWTHGNIVLGLHVSLQLANSRPYFLGRCTDTVGDELNLFYLSVARQVRNAQDDLSHDRADTPYINGTAIKFGTVEQLRWAVPACNDVRGHVAIRVGEGAGKTKISQLDLAIGGNQQVVGLYIAMQYKVLVTEPDGANQHAHPCLDISRSVADALMVADEHLQVAEREVLEDETDILILRGENGQKRDDVGVGQLAEVFQFAHGVGCEALGVLFLLLDLLDSDELGRVGADVAEIDNGIGTFTKLLACSQLTQISEFAENSKSSRKHRGRRTLDVFLPLLKVHLLSKIHHGSLGRLASWP